MSENGKLTSMVSTRASVEMAGLLYDGFELGERLRFQSIHSSHKMVVLIRKELTSNNWYKSIKKMKMENHSSTMLMRTPMKRMRTQFLSFKVNQLFT